MIKILKSLAIITAVVAIAGGGTYALWTDSANINGSTFSAGTMNLKIDKNPDSDVYVWSDGFHINEISGAQDLFKGLYPGYPTNPGTGTDQERNWQVVDLKNVDGSVDSVVTFKVKKVSGSDDLANNLILKVYFDDENDGFGDNTTPILNATLSGYGENVYTLGEINGDPNDTSGGLKGEMASVKIEWSVPRSAGNEIQGDSVTIDTTFGLQQK